MSSTDDSGRERRDQVSPGARATAGAIRRFTLGTTTGVKWQVLGHTLLDGKQETRSAEVFSNIGFFSRPKGGANTDALAVFVGGAQNPVIVATRDEDARKAIVPAGDDLAAMFTSGAIALLKATTMEVRLAAGAAQIEPTVKGTTYRSAEDTLLTAIGAFASACGLAVPALITPAATLNAAITTFKAAAASYLTTVLKAQ